GPGVQHRWLNPRCQGGRIDDEDSGRDRNDANSLVEGADEDQWYAWVASWLGWTLDAFDFTMFLLIMVPISQEFGVPLTEVAFLLSVTLWLRLVGAVGSGWLADRIGRKTPLMISILWYSICNFIAGFSPTFGFLFLFRAL